MKKYIKASISEYDCIDECTQGVIEYIEEGSAWSYDDVISETYAQIQDYFDSMGESLDDNTEDRLYEEVMSKLDDLGYIDHHSGDLLFEYED